MSPRDAPGGRGVTGAPRGHVGTVAGGISEWPRYWARTAPERPAIWHDGEVLTWRALEDRAARLAAGLRSDGVRAGDRVGLVALNRPEFFEVLVACARIGAIFVPYNVRLTDAELRHITQHAGLSALIVDDPFGARLHAFAADVPARCTYFLDAPPDGGRSVTDLLAAGRIDEPIDVGLDDPLLLAYTSGTTGLPKAATVTHGNAAAVSIAVICADGVSARDRIALPAPLAFAGSVLAIGLPFLHAGGSMLIERTFDATRLLHHVEHTGVTMLKLVPSIYQMMAETPGFAERDLSGVRSATSGGAPVPLDLVRTYRRHGLAIGGAYGLTEGGGFNLHLPSHDAIERDGWTGLPLPFQEITVVRADGDLADPGEVGEMVIRGQCVMRGYWEAPEQTAEVIRDGWLHTGDLAIRDEHGYLKVVDRLKDLIICGGINVYPAEVERVLRTHPDVVDAAVVGVPDPRWGETPVACVVSTRADLTLADLHPLLAEELADYKRPRRLELMDALPRNANLKVQKSALRTQLSAPPGP